MSECGEINPEHPDKPCRERGLHLDHSGGYGVDMIHWPNESVSMPVHTTPSTQAQATGKLLEMKRRVAKESHVRPVKALARRDDPWSSHVAAQRIAPKLGTRKAEVLAMLQAHVGEWVSGVLLATEECGGSEGLKRLRELRIDDGWPIERKPLDHGTTWQYMLPKED